MSDGGHQQRVLDLIDDPTALETFLGGLTSDSELLPSADSVDNVVASLARSLEDDYVVDSPNETLFDTLEASSNNLTDISQSYVSSDFENAISNAGQGFSSLGSISNGEMSTIVTPGVEQFLITQTNSNASSNTTTNLQFSSSDCDSSSASQFLQNSIQMNSNQIMLESSNNNTSYSLSQELHKQTIVNQTQQQITSLSSTSVNNLESISVALSNNQNNGQVTSHLQFQQQNSSNEMSQRGHIQLVNQQVSNLNSLTPASSTSSISIAGSTTSSEMSTNSIININNNSNNNNNNSSISSSIIQQPQYIQSTTQQTTINQIMSGAQTVSLGNVGGTQIIATSTGNIVSGQTQANIIQQIQAAGGGQSYITVDQSTAALLAGQAGFGATNLALVSTGGTPTYAVVNSGGAQYLSNAIMTQPQTIQTLTKGPNGTYFQTTGGAQLVQTSNVNQVQQTVANNPAPNKPKQPPQLLPKPQSASSPIISTTVTDSDNNSIAVSAAQGTTNTVSASDNVVAQLFQQQGIQGMNQVVVTSSMGNLIPQQSFSISGATGLGQMVLSQNPAQTQLTGTIVVNQYGQPMLVPNASSGQTGLQFIVRPQQQLLTLPGLTSGGKPMVRYVSQMPQLAQSGGYGLQQIQTANGPAWVAVRYPQTTANVQTSQINQIQTETLQSAISGQPQQQIQAQIVQPQPTTSPAPVVNSSQLQTNTSRPSTPALQQQQNPPVTQDSTPDSSSEPPPAKKPRSRPKSRAKKVTLDLEQLLKQSGIMDEDLEEDSSFDFFSSQDVPQNGFDSPVTQQSDYSAQPSMNASPVQHPDVNTSSKVKGGGSSKRKSSTVTGTATTPGSKKKKGSQEKTRSPTPPPPPPPPPQPTPKSKAKRKSGNQKADTKTDNSKIDVPKKLSSLDDISATINAVAIARTPSPPSSPASSVPMDSPFKESTYVPTTSMTLSSPVNSSSIKAVTTLQATLVTPTPTMTPMSIPPNGYISNNAIASIPSSNVPAGTTRIVQTIQLTPQNQQLLRNIQAQIARLLSLPKRNDTEQTALQKLIVLQQQVIATGIPVPNPAHLNNENNTGGNLVVSSNLASGTSTTNAFGQHHVQSFPPTFRSTVDEKKTEEQRLATFKVEEDKRARWKKEEFEMLLKRDQQCVTQPDYEIPFTSKRDAVERLMKYHILRDRNDMTFTEFDQDFGEKSVVLLDKFNGMLSKYRSLLLKESMKEVGCAERVMLERMFVTEEKLKLEQDRLLVGQGEVIELPPPPSHWLPKVQEMADKEMSEMEQDSYVSMQVQSAIDSIISFGNPDNINPNEESENKVEYDAFGVPISSSGTGGGYNNGFSTSSADIDEAVRSILS